MLEPVKINAVGNCGITIKDNGFSDVLDKIGIIFVRFETAYFDHFVSINKLLNEANYDPYYSRVITSDKSWFYSHTVSVNIFSDLGVIHSIFTHNLRFMQRNR